MSASRSINAVRKWTVVRLLPAIAVDALMQTSDRPIQPPLLEVRDLCLNFSQRFAIESVSFRINAGSTLGLVGASGAGKSSIARAIMHLIKPDSGQILLNGTDTANLNSRQMMAVRQRIQIVFQEPSASLSPRRTVAQTLVEPLQHFAIGKRDDRLQKVKDILHTVGLSEDVLQRYPHQFSSGQQQRIAIARALITEPDLLIADEAVSSLDVSVQAQILQLIQRLQREHGIAFLFISHDLAVIRQIADQVAVMYRGKILEDAPADVFFNQPSHPYSKALLAFAESGSISSVSSEQMRLTRGNKPAGHSQGCVYERYCAEKMPVCRQTEPINVEIQHKNQHDSGSHCVRCHLYDSRSD